MQIDYNRSGGFYIIKRVKLSEDSNQYIDYSILIESIQDKAMGSLLKRLCTSQSSTSSCTFPILFPSLAPCLNGLGRIVQYSLDSAEDPSPSLLCLYDGLITQGRPHTFGRATFCATPSLQLFLGPFMHGVPLKNRNGVRNRGLWMTDRGGAARQGQAQV